MLKAVALRLRSVVDERDLLARLGGDEFAVVCDADAPAGSEVQPLSATTLAGRIVAALKEPFSIDGVTVSIGTSIGIASIDSLGRTAEQLMRDADLALYRAKGMGRGMWCLFEAQLNPSADERPNPTPCSFVRAA